MARDSHKHICMLPRQPASTHSWPRAGACSRLRRLLLPAAWHHGYQLFVRSRKSLQQEQLRQVNSGHWCVWHPYCPLRFCWYCFSLAVNVLAFLYMPVLVFIPCSDPYDPFILFSDVVALCDIGANFLTGRADEDGRLVILDPRRIARRYLRGTFALDLVGALPLQLIELSKECQYPVYTIFFLVKLLRMIPTRRAWKNLYTQLRLTYPLRGALTVVGHTVLFTHWMTFVHFQIPVLCAHWMDNNQNVVFWLRRFKVGLRPPASTLDKYVSNLYGVAGLCVGAGTYSPVSRPVEPELLLDAALGIIGMLYMIYCFTALIRMVIYKRFDNYLYNGRLKELEDYMVFKRLPQNLQQKIHLFINYKFNGHYFNESSILHTVNKQIKQDMNMFCCRRLVLNVPIFQDLPIALVNMIIFSLVQVLYMPGEVVVKFGHPGSSIYLVSSGTVACMDAEGQEVAHLKDGAYFGQRALLSPGISRSATVIALEITETYRLTSKQFQECLLLCPRLKRRLEQHSRALQPSTLHAAPLPPARSSLFSWRNSVSSPPPPRDSVSSPPPPRDSVFSHTSRRRTSVSSSLPPRDSVSSPPPPRDSMFSHTSRRRTSVSSSLPPRDSVSSPPPPRDSMFSHSSRRRTSVSSSLPPRDSVSSPPPPRDSMFSHTSRRRTSVSSSLPPRDSVSSPPPPRDSMFSHSSRRRTSVSSSLPPRDSVSSPPPPRDSVSSHPPRRRRTSAFSPLRGSLPPPPGAGDPPPRGSNN